MDYFRTSNLRLPLFLSLILALLLLQDYCRHDSASFGWYWCFLWMDGGSVDSPRTAIGFSSSVLGRYCYKPEYTCIGRSILEASRLCKHRNEHNFVLPEWRISLL
jgi:hypothetical protein